MEMKEERITKKYRGKMTNHNQMDRPNLKIGGKYKKTGNGRRMLHKKCRENDQEEDPEPDG